VFEPQRTWRSARTGATWPVGMRVTLGAGSPDALTLDLEAMFDDQELDARTSTGTRLKAGVPLRESITA
jgi:hypothetical protein